MQHNIPQLPLVQVYSDTNFTGETHNVLTSINRTPTTQRKARSANMHTRSSPKITLTVFGLSGSLQTVT